MVAVAIAVLVAFISVTVGGASALTVAGSSGCVDVDVVECIDESELGGDVWSTVVLSVDATAILMTGSSTGSIVVASSVTEGALWRSIDIVVLLLSSESVVAVALQ